MIKTPVHFLSFFVLCPSGEVSLNLMYTTGNQRKSCQKLPVRPLSHMQTVHFISSVMFFQKKVYISFSSVFHQFLHRSF